MFPVTFNEVKVPTLVILGCAAVVTVPADRAEVASNVDPDVTVQAPVIVPVVALAPVVNVLLVSVVCT